MAAPNDISLLEGSFDFDQTAEQLAEEYEAIKGAEVDSLDVIPKDDIEPLVDIPNLLFGDEMSSFGVTLDRKGFNWNIETAKDFWAQHPVRAALATATTVLPVVGALSRPYRLGKAMSLGDDVIRQAGWVDEAQDLSRVAPDDLELMRANLHEFSTYRDRMDRIEALGDQASLKEKAYYYLQKGFSNNYAEYLDGKKAFDLRAEWVKNTQRLLGEGGYLSRHLDKLPPDDIAGPLSMYLANPQNLSLIPNRHREWAVRMADDFKTTQKAAIEEGFIAADEVENIGELWFPMVRNKTKWERGGLTTVLDESSGKAKVYQVPRTTSPSLLNRKASKQEVTQHVKKQYATELLSQGKNDEALSLLTEPGYADVRTLIDSGDNASAIRLLGVEGKVDFSPKALTFNGLFEQKMLLENYRLLRDLAMNTDIVKSVDDWAMLSPKAKKGWMSLDSIDGADRLRRMVAIKKQVDPSEIKSLGYVPKSLFREIGQITKGEDLAAKTGLLGLLTAVHKLSKVAYSVPTHGQNWVGNAAFLANAGINPFSKEFGSLVAKSYGAVRNLQRASREGRSISDVRNLGTIESKVGGPRINLADELNSPELKEMVELESMLASESVAVLENSIKQGGFVGGLAKALSKPLKSKVLHTPADSYMAADGGAKMAYFLNLRQRGFSRAAAAVEVGKRLPMYSSIGGVAKEARGWWLPWISFPAESARILKNNIMDHPLKTALMLQIPEMAQVGMYSAAGLMGRPMNYQSIQERKEQLATWAYRPSTSISPIRDQNGDYRSMVMDFLPFSSVMPPTLSQHAPALKKLPFGGDDPSPILQGLYTALTGKDAWGRDIPVDPNQPSQKVAIMAMSFMDFVSPPFIQKYMFNPTDPSQTHRLFTDAGKAVNTYTNNPGDPVFDLFVNNLLPIKMWPSNPEQRLANESFTKGRISAFRSFLAKNWGAELKSGQIEEAANTMRKIMKTFYEEWKDPEIAQRKMTEWLKNHASTIKNHPQLRRFGAEELAFLLSQLENDSALARSRAHKEYIETIRRELALRGRSSRGGSVNPFLGGLGGQGLGGGGLGGGGLGRQGIL